MNSIKVIKNKVEQIQQHLIRLYQDSQHCIDFLQIEGAVLNHYLEVLKYLNQSFEVIHQQYPDSQINTLLKAQLINLNHSKVLAQHIDINLIDQLIQELSLQIDQLVFVTKDLPSLNSRFHAKLHAQALTELFDLQSRYIYPYHPELVPEHLKQINFVDKNFSL